MLKHAEAYRKDEIMEGYGDLTSLGQMLFSYLRHSDDDDVVVIVVVVIQNEFRHEEG